MIRGGVYLSQGDEACNPARAGGSGTVNERNRDLSPTETARLVQVLSATLPPFGEHKICFRLSAPNRA